MSIAKVCVLIDGGFLESSFKKSNPGQSFTSDNVLHEVSRTIEAIRTKTAEDSETIEDVLYRIFYYDCLPFGGTIKKIDGGQKDFSMTQAYRDKLAFLDELAKRERVALRIGQLAFTGWAPQIDYSAMQPTITGYRPLFRQKGVDMKFGLDMAWLATRKVVDKIALIAGDSDFITPIKFARKEGLQVYLNHLGNPIKDDLIKHCDFII